jgi:hypothetical protein
MTQTSTFKTPEGKAAYFEAYKAAMKLWPVPYEEMEIPTRRSLASWWSLQTPSRNTPATSMPS